MSNAVERKNLLKAAKPILFNTDMVKEILNGRKTVTRRAVKPGHLQVLDSPYHKEHPEIPDRVLIEKLCKAPYEPDTILYVRETWDNLPVLPDGTHCGYDHYYYKADGDLRPEGWRGSWHPSIHMLRGAARIFLQVTDVRVERLQEITWQQAAAEGCYGSTSDKPDPLFHLPTLRGEFAKLWDSTVKKTDHERYGWDANPWVWVIEFEKEIPDV